MYKRRFGFIVTIVVICVHGLSGLQIFCTDGFIGALRVPGSLFYAGAVTASGNANVSADNSVNSNTKGGTLPCSCKKKKKCPAIPRAAITSNPTHRPSEFQRLAKSECCDSLVPQVVDLRFFTRGNTPLLELAWCSPFYSSTPLALTCVLLI